MIVIMPERRVSSVAVISSSVYGSNNAREEGCMCGGVVFSLL